MLMTIDWEAPEAGRQLVNHLHNTGFAVLRNHPVDLAGLTALRDAWRKWFEECTAKESYRHDYTQVGWFGRHHAEKPVDGGGRRDDKEYFQFFLNAIDQAPRNLQGITREHFMEMSAFAKSVAATIEANSPIDAGGGLWKSIQDSPNTMLRILYYASLDDGEMQEIKDRKIEDCRAGAHTDVNLFTMIPCNAEPGLQLKDNMGVWRFVPWHQSYLVVNAGDMLEKMSNGYFPSALHRVVTPGFRAEARMSLPFFVHPRSEVEIEKGLTAGDFLADRLRALEVR